MYGLSQHQTLELFDRKFWSLVSSINHKSANINHTRSNQTKQTTYIHNCYLASWPLDTTTIVISITRNRIACAVPPDASACHEALTVGLGCIEASHGSDRCRWALQASLAQKVTVSCRSIWVISYFQVSRALVWDVLQSETGSQVKVLSLTVVLVRHELMLLPGLVHYKRQLRCLISEMAVCWESAILCLVE